MKAEINNITFQMEGTDNVDSTIVNNTMRASVIVWERHRPRTPTTMRFRFVESLSSTRRPTDGSSDPVVTQLTGHYNLYTDIIDLSAKVLNENIPQGLSAQHQAAMAAGHEVRHRVQFLEGENVRPSATMTSEEYAQDLHELEARESEKDVLRELFPHAYSWIAYGINTVSRARSNTEFPSIKTIPAQEESIIDIASGLLIPKKKTFDIKNKRK